VRVVVVDDEADMREVIARLLQGQGAIVTTAASAREGLLAVEQERPHVLVSDIGMPHEDGYALIRNVRALEVDPARRVAALALTASAGPEAVAKAELAGFQKHLTKPASPKRLIEEVARLAAYAAELREPGRGS
jgi:CheY-like chemotaxis protein